MTREEFITAVEATGGEDAWIMERPDAIGVTFGFIIARLDGESFHASALAAMLKVLLEWITNAPDHRRNRN